MNDQSAEGGRSLRDKTHSEIDAAIRSLSVCQALIAVDNDFFGEREAIEQQLGLDVINEALAIRGKTNVLPFLANGERPPRQAITPSSNPGDTALAPRSEHLNTPEKSNDD